MSSPSTVSLVIIDDNTGSLELLSAALAREGLTIFTKQEGRLDISTLLFPTT